MYMRRNLVEMHVEADYVLLSVAVAHKSVHILSPIINFGHTLQVEVILVKSGIIVHLLVTESHFAHLVAAAAQNKVSDGAEFRLLSTLVRVLYTPFTQILSHSLRHTPAFVNGADNTALGDLKIETFA